MQVPPPGPKSIGLIDFLRAGFVSPAPVLQRLSATYGDPFRIHAQGEWITFTGDPEAIRAVYTADPDLFDVRGADITQPIFGSTSLTVSTGARHRRDRRLLSPPFNAGAMRRYAAAMAAAARVAAARWTPGRAFSMLESTQEIALDIIVRVVFGVEGEARVRQTREAVLRLIDAMSPLVFLVPSLRRDFWGVGPWARLQRASRGLEALLLEEIRARRAAPSADAQERNDVLGLLVRTRDEGGGALSDEELCEQLRTLLFAGHETTAMAMAWAMYRLHRDPAALARAHAEIDALGADPEPNALASLPYLDAACHEALRMHPPVVDVGRVTRRPLSLGRFVVPAGESIVPSPLLLHRREDLYPEPDRFLPDRFLDWRPSPFELIAFGGGARRCLGAAFALFEMKVVLGTLLGEHRLRVAGAAPVTHRRRGITMGPSGEVPMVLEGKRAPRDARRPRPEAPPEAATCPAGAHAARCPVAG